MLKEKILKEDTLIGEEASIKEGLKKLNKAPGKVLLVVDDNDTLLGTITDGDIRRHLLKGKDIDDNITEAYNKTPNFLEKKDFTLKKAKEILLKKSVKLLPVVDEQKKILYFISRKQVLSASEISLIEPLRKIDVPVVIMAGGKSTRLEPFSKIFPKPLLPVGDKPIIEIIIDEFRKHGVDEYYVTLNFKGKMIESYFESKEKNYKMDYVWENDFYGTAGSLKLLEDKISDVFIVSNCDVIVKADFEEVVNLHREQNAALTILSSIQHYEIPYGVIIFKEHGEVINIHEKPEYTLTVNAGTYVLNKEFLKFIPEKTHFDMTDLIKILVKNGQKVITYPVNENDYIDVGQWEEYKKVSDKLQRFM